MDRNGDCVTPVKRFGDQARTMPCKELRQLVDISSSDVQIARRIVPISFGPTDFNNVSEE
jgi:hypothetical protein